MSTVLPDGWSVQLDPASGRTYYFNMSTGQSSWTPPSPEVLPPGWIVQTEASGKKYYANPTTGQSQWNAPAFVPAAPAPAPAPAPPPADMLAQLQDLGFSAQQAKAALSRHSSVEASVEWLASVGDNFEAALANARLRDENKDVIKKPVLARPASPSSMHGFATASKPPSAASAVLTSAAGNFTSEDILPLHLAILQLFPMPDPNRLLEPSAFFFNSRSIPTANAENPCRSEGV